jgi:hypothetical protein
MPRTDRPKLSPDQEPLLISLKRWEDSVEKEIERRLNSLLDLETSPLIRSLKSPELLRLKVSLSLRLLRELLSRSLEPVSLLVALLMERLLRKSLPKLTPENWFVPNDKIYYL